MKDTEQVQKHVNQALDQQIENMDSFTEARIKAARLNALAAKPSSWWRNISLPQGIAASALSVFVVALVLNPFESADQGVLELSESQLMAAMNPVLTEDPEMLEQLEFMAWLEQEAILEQGGQS